MPGTANHSTCNIDNITAVEVGSPLYFDLNQLHAHHVSALNKTFYMKTCTPQPGGMIGVHSCGWPVRVTRIDWRRCTTSNENRPGNRCLLLTPKEPLRWRIAADALHSLYHSFKESQNVFGCFGIYLQRVSSAVSPPPTSHSKNVADGSFEFEETLGLYRLIQSKRADARKVPNVSAGPKIASNSETLARLHDIRK